MSSFKEQMACRQIFHIFSGRLVSLPSCSCLCLFCVWSPYRDEMAWNVALCWKSLNVDLKWLNCFLSSLRSAPPNLTNLKNCHFSISILQKRKCEFDPSAPATLETFSNSSNFTIESCFRGQKWKVKNAKNVVRERSKEEKFFQLRRVQK